MVAHTNGSSNCDVMFAGRSPCEVTVSGGMNAEIAASENRDTSRGVLNDHVATVGERRLAPA
jgi:hypothetical protein